MMNTRRLLCRQSSMLSRNLLSRTLLSRTLLWLALYLLTGFWSFSVMASSSSLQRLQDDGRLIIEASLATQEVAVRQQMIVTIDILTDTWFTKGTRLHRFDVDNALVLQRSPFANNSIERIHGKTYSKQSWEVVVYPLGTGRYSIPSIVVDLWVKDGKSNVSGQLNTKPLSFNGVIPDVRLTQPLSFVGEQPLLEQTWSVIHSSHEMNASETELPSTLQVGDAIERTITLAVNDTTATLLPDLTGELNNDNQLITYQESPTFKDEQDRGVYSAIRTEKTVYVVQDAGALTFPAQEFIQWSSEQQALILHRTSAQSFVVKHTIQSYFYAYWHTIFAVIIAVILATIGMILARNKYIELDKKGRLPLWWQFGLALQSKDHLKCENLLYQQHYKTTGSHNLATASRCAMPQTQQPSLIKLQQRRYKCGEEGASLLSWQEWLRLWWHR